MCLIIDACTISSVFDPSNKDHTEFSPVFNWIANENGVMIYGGKKYKDELKAMKKYLKIINELKRRGRVIELNESAIDAIQKEVESIEEDGDFDDPHLIAIIIYSGCKVICTLDKRAHPFLKKRGLYLKKARRPHIYSGQRHKFMLDDRNIIKICSSKKQ
jgi:predicted nucleic acid-binding protein